MATNESWAPLIVSPTDINKLVNLFPEEFEGTGLKPNFQYPDADKRNKAIADAQLAFAGLHKKSDDKSTERGINIEKELIRQASEKYGWNQLREFKLPDGEKSQAKAFDVDQQVHSVIRLDNTLFVHGKMDAVARDMDTGALTLLDVKSGSAPLRDPQTGRMTGLVDVAAADKKIQEYADSAQGKLYPRMLGLPGMTFEGTFFPNKTTEDYDKAYRNTAHATAATYREMHAMAGAIRRSLDKLGATEDVERISAKRFIENVWEPAQGPYATDAQRAIINDPQVILWEKQQRERASGKDQADQDRNVHIDPEIADTAAAKQNKKLEQQKILDPMQFSAEDNKAADDTWQLWSIFLDRYGLADNSTWNKTTRDHFLQPGARKSAVQYMAHMEREGQFANPEVSLPDVRIPNPGGKEDERTDASQLTSQSEDEAIGGKGVHTVGTDVQSKPSSVGAGERRRTGAMGRLGESELARQMGLEALLPGQPVPNSYITKGSGEGRAYRAAVTASQQRYLALKDGDVELANYYQQIFEAARPHMRGGTLERVNNSLVPLETRVKEIKAERAADKKIQHRLDKYSIDEAKAKGNPIMENFFASRAGDVDTANDTWWSQYQVEHAQARVEQGLSNAEDRRTLQFEAWSSKYNAPEYNNTPLQRLFRDTEIDAVQSPQDWRLFLATKAQATADTRTQRNIDKRKQAGESLKAKYKGQPEYQPLLARIDTAVQNYAEWKQLGLDFANKKADLYIAKAGDNEQEKINRRVASVQRMVAKKPDDIGLQQRAVDYDGSVEQLQEIRMYQAEQIGAHRLEQKEQQKEQKEQKEQANLAVLQRRYQGTPLEPLLTQFAQNRANVRAFQQTDEWDQLSRSAQRAYQDSASPRTLREIVATGQREWREDRTKQREAQKDLNGWEKVGASKSQAASVGNRVLVDEISRIQRTASSSADALRMLNTVLEENAKKTQQLGAIMKGFGAVRFYDYMKNWDEYKGQMNGVVSAGSWAIPGFLQGSANRINQAIQQQTDSQLAKPQAILKTAEAIAPIAGGVIGAVFGGAPGAMAGATMAKGAFAGITQIHGNMQWAGIRERGELMQSRLNFWGAIVEPFKNAFGFIFDIGKGAFKLLGDAVKGLVHGLKLGSLAIGAFIAGLTTRGFDEMKRLGNPMYSITGDQSYATYQHASIADMYTGQSQGSTYSSMENIARTSTALFSLGQYNQTQLVSAALLGRFSDLYNPNMRNSTEDYANIIDSETSKMLNMPDAEKRKRMWYWEQYDPSMAKTLQTTLNASKAYGRAVSYNEISGTGKEGMAYYGLKNFRTIGDTEREDFRKASTAFGIIGENIKVNMMRGAFNWFTNVGDSEGRGNGISKQVYNWFEEFTEIITRADFKITDAAHHIGKGFGIIGRFIDQSLANSFLSPVYIRVRDWIGRMYDLVRGGDFAGAFAELAAGFKTAWAVIGGPIIEAVGGTLAKIMIGALKLVGPVIPGLTASLIKGLGYVAKTGFDMFLNLSESVWNIFRDTVLRMSAVGLKIDPVKLFTGKGDWIEFAQPFSETVEDIEDQQRRGVRSTNFWDTPGHVMSALGAQREFDRLDDVYEKMGDSWQLLNTRRDRGMFMKQRPWQGGYKEREWYAAGLWAKATGGDHIPRTLLKAIREREDVGLESLPVILTDYFQKTQGQPYTSEEFERYDKAMEIFERAKLGNPVDDSFSAVRTHKDEIYNALNLDELAEKAAIATEGGVTALQEWLGRMVIDMNIKTDGQQTAAISAELNASTKEIAKQVEVDTATRDAKAAVDETKRSFAELLRAIERGAHAPASL